MSKSSSLAKAYQQCDADLKIPAPAGDNGPWAVSAGVLPEGAMPELAAGARDLQAQLADAFSPAYEDDAVFLDEGRYPLAVTFGVTVLVCAVFWTAVGFGVRSLLLG